MHCMRMGLAPLFRMPMGLPHVKLVPSKSHHETNGQAEVQGIRQANWNFPGLLILGDGHVIRTRQETPQTLPTTGDRSDCCLDWSLACR